MFVNVCVCVIQNLLKTLNYLFIITNIYIINELYNNFLTKPLSNFHRQIIMSISRLFKNKIQTATTPNRQ